MNEMRQKKKKGGRRPHRLSSSSLSFLAFSSFSLRAFSASRSCEGAGERKIQDGRRSAAYPGARASPLPTEKKKKSSRPPAGCRARLLAQLPLPLAVELRISL